MSAARWIDDGCTGLWTMHNGLLIDRHGWGEPGLWQMRYFVSPEVASTFGIPPVWHQALAVVDDFGNLVRVPS